MALTPEPRVMSCPSCHWELLCLGLSGDFDAAGNAAEAAGASGVIFQPPVTLSCDCARKREENFSHLISNGVIPRLLARHNGKDGEADQRAGGSEVDHLTSLLLGPESSAAFDYVMKLKDDGVCLDRLHIELLEPTARHFGELWEEDEVDFLDVTIGVSRLQRLVHKFAELDELPEYDDRRRALILTAPGDQHGFGKAIVEKFLRAGGWCVVTADLERPEDAGDLVANDWFGVVGFSLSADQHLDKLAESVRHVRNRSVNPTVGVMVGGPAFAGHPERVARVAADGTAANGPAAVILAKKLLVKSLEALKPGTATA